MAAQAGSANWEAFFYGSSDAANYAVTTVDGVTLYDLSGS